MTGINILNKIVLVVDQYPQYNSQFLYVCVLLLDLSNCKVLQNFEDILRKRPTQCWPRNKNHFVVKLQYRRETNG